MSDEVKMVPCDVCDGDGEEVCNFGYPHECAECDGSGEVEGHDDEDDDE